MKVFFLVNIPSPYRVDFFNELSKYCDLTVIYERENASDRNNNWFKDVKRQYKEIFLNGKKIGHDNSICLSVIKEIDLNADIVVLGMYSTFTAMIAQLYLRINKKPFILSTDGGFPKKDNPLVYLLKKSLISNAECWLCSGEMAAQYFMYYGAKKSSIHLYPFSSVHVDDINIRRNSSESIMYKNIIDKDYKYVALSVGQIIYRKGYDVLIEAAARLPQNIAWIIVGGNASSDLLDLMNERGVTNVYFIDFVSPEKIKAYYENADFFVLPTREDIWGLVVNEAFAHGLPVITTDKCIAGVEMIKDENCGFIAKADNVDSFVECVEKLLEDNYLLDRDIDKQESVIREYTIENMALVHKNIFMKVINCRKHLYKNN